MEFEIKEQPQQATKHVGTECTHKGPQQQKLFGL